MFYATSQLRHSAYHSTPSGALGLSLSLLYYFFLSRDLTQLEEIIDIVQVKMNKLLSANELEFVKEWVFDKGYNKDKIVEIIASIEAQNKKVTFRSLMVAMENYGKYSSNDELSKLMEKIRA